MLTPVTPCRARTASDTAGLEVVADRAARSRQRDGHVDDAVGMDVDRADHLERDDVLAKLWVDYRTQRVGDLFSGGHVAILADALIGSAAARGVKPQG